MPWHLELSLGGMRPTAGYPSGPDRDVFTYRNANAILSVIVENAHSPATLDSCRDVFARRRQQGLAAIGLINEVQGQRGEAATQEYDVPIASGGELAVHHDAFSCRVRGNYYIDIHASRIGYQPADHDALIALIDGVKIVE